MTRKHRKKPHDNQIDDTADTSDSKTARKRDAKRLQDMGRAIAELSDEGRAPLQLPDNLERAIVDYRRFPSREAKRRQLQYVGKLMRSVDIDVISEHLDTLAGESATARYELHQLEQWRDRLLATDGTQLQDTSDALTDFMAEFPHANTQVLKNHVRKYRQMSDEAGRKKAARAFFRMLREEIAFQDQDPDLGPELGQQLGQQLGPQKEPTSESTPADGKTAT